MRIRSGKRFWILKIAQSGRTESKEVRLLDGKPLVNGSRIRMHIDRDKFTVVVTGIHTRKLL